MLVVLKRVHAEVWDAVVYEFHPKEFHQSCYQERTIDLGKLLIAV